MFPSYGTKIKFHSIKDENKRRSWNALSVPQVPMGPVAFKAVALRAAAAAGAVSRRSPGRSRS